MKKKALLAIITVILIILCGLSVFGCSNGEVPVDTIVVTKLPKLEYFRGDFFELASSEITVYYENGKSKVVPLTLEMLSLYDAQNIGDQTLTIKYEDTTAYIKVTVLEAPIYSISVVEGNYKKEYVQGQILDVNGINLKITYSNNFSETIPVTAEMIAGFDSEAIGEKQLVVTYKGKTAKFNIDVVRKGIANLETLAPNKLRYVVGDEIDLTGGKIFVAYNNNTQEYINMTDLLGSPDFVVNIDKEEGNIFTKSALARNIFITYKGKECPLFAVNVAELKATKLEIATDVVSPVVNAATVFVGEGVIKITYNDGSEITVPATAENISDYYRKYNIVDMSAGSVKITYNNKSTSIISTDDEQLEIRWGEFDISRLGVYEIHFVYEELSLSYQIEVIDAKEVEIIVWDSPESVYQDSGDIDITQWTYSIKLANGKYRAFDSLGTIISSVHNGMIKAGTNPNFSTETVGVRTIVLAYSSMDNTINLTKTITVNVLPKEIVAIEEFEKPTIKIFNQNDIIDGSGGRFKVRYNDGTISGWINVNKDMQVVPDSLLTSNISDSVVVELLYIDPIYPTQITFSYEIAVIKKATSIVYEASSSLGLKLSYIKGESFDNTNLVITINYSDESTKKETDFSSIEWHFTGNEFDAVGSAAVRLYYGDISKNIFAEIPVSVTNNIVSIEKDTSFVDFGTVVEGMDISVNNAYIIITREDGSSEQIKVTAGMTDYSKTDKTLGVREVSISYQSFAITTTVNVVKRSLTEFKITNKPTKLNYVYTDLAIDLSGMQLNFKFNNNTTATISGSAIMGLDIDSQNASAVVYNLTIGTNTYLLSVDKLNTDIGASQYMEQTVTVAILAGEEILFYSSFDIICFQKLISRIYFEIPGEQEQSFMIKEGYDLTFPPNAVIRVVYEDTSTQIVNLSTLDTSEYEVVGYAKDSAGTQNITLKYLFSQCNFTVKVRAKLLDAIIIEPQQISVVEGMAISSDDLLIKLRFVDADGIAYDPSMFIEVELSSATCSYNKDTPVIFSHQDANNHWYFEDIYTISYTYNYYDFVAKTNKSITKTEDILIRINRKLLVDIIMHSPTKTVYIEDIEGAVPSALDLTGGYVLVSYNNGTNMKIDLSNINLTVNDSAFDTSEIHNGSERNQTIYVSYTENNITVQTFYTVVVKDRRYLNINFAETPFNNTYLFEYGTGVAARPNFSVSGYLTYSGARVVLADNSDIDTIEGFSVYYIDKDQVASPNWPSDAGTYTLAIAFEGNAVNNPFLYTGSKIEIYPKSIVIRAEETTFTYGQTYTNEHDVFSWYVQGYRKNGDVITYTDNPLVGTDTQEMVASVSFRFTTKAEQNIAFYSADNTTIVNASVGIYNLYPFMVEKLSANYKIEEFKAADLTIEKKEIKIVAKSAQKVYGEEDPRFEFWVYDYANDSLIGGNIGGIASAIWLGGYQTGYRDAIPNYSLGRLPTDTNNVSDNGNHKIMAGAANQISNYLVKSYTDAQLTVTPKPITICADALQKSYGSATPNIVYKLQSGSTLGYGESFIAVFANHINKGGTKYDISIYHADNLSANLAVNNDLPSNTNVGSYKIKLNIVPTDLPNYNITVEMVDLNILPTAVDISIPYHYVSYNSVSLDTVADIDEAGWYNFAVNGNDIQYSFEEGYLLDSSEVALSFVKQQGKNVGKYQIKLSQNCHNVNTNFVLNLLGNYGEFYAEILSMLDSYDGIPESMPQTVGSDANKCYLMIAPVNLEIDFDESGESYSRRTSMWIENEYITASGKITNESVISGLDAALTYELTNKNITRANLGYYTADDYFGKLKYDYLTNENSKNYFYLLDTFSDRIMTGRLYNFILNGIEESMIMEYEFEYTIYPYELNIEILNGNTSYNGTQKSISYSNYSLAHPSDSLTILNEIKVVYNDTAVQVSATKIQEAGAYSVVMTGVSNYNYSLSEVTLARVKNFEVSAIELKVVIDRSKLTRAYTGKSLQPLDNKWVDLKGADDEIGYYRTSTHKIINDVLSEAPKTISIYPVDLSGNTPRDAGEHEIVVRINSTYKNMTVVFVERNPAWNTGDSIETKYIPTTYIFNITKKKITLYNWDRCNKKTFDNAQPIVNNLNQLIINNVAPGDTLTTSDLIFSFTRDMSAVPVTLRSLIDISDMTSAGYFTVSITIKQSNANWNNYYFEIDGNENYYLINRVSVPITLNTSNSSLTKQYDKAAPSGVFEQLNVGQIIVLDDVYYDIVVDSYYKNGFWNNWSSSSVFDIGIYSYNLRAKYLTEGGSYGYFENGAGQPLYDETYTTNKLLSWNYCYYISKQIGLDTNNCDGVYSITKKDISIGIENAQDENYSYGSGVYAERYVYSKTYNNQTITLTSALSQINGLYTILDNNGDALNLSYYNDFVKLNITGSGSSIKNAGQYFDLSFDDMVNANPNYNITNKPIVYAIKKLVVNLSLTFSNTDNEGLPSMTFGDKAFENGKISFVLDFIDLAAFNTATGYSYATINDFISSNSSDYNNDKLITSATYFKLGSYYTSTIGSMVSGRPYTRLNAGNYTPSESGLEAMNYQIAIFGVTFSVLPKEIVINGLMRDYFSKDISADYYIAGGTIDSLAENAILNSWHFVDNTAVNADASDFNQNMSYYGYILKSAMVTNNANYVLNILQCDGLSGTNEAYYYLPLTVNKVNLVLGLNNALGSAIVVPYGHVLNTTEYKWSYGNLPLIDNNSQEYNPAVEKSKQDSVLRTIENDFMNIDAILHRISITAVGVYTFSLAEFIRDGVDLDSLANYSVTLSTEVPYEIIKIIINLELVNNAGMSYNQNGYFSIIYDERNSLTYSVSSNQRLTYSFNILNPNAIIRPDGVTLSTLVERMTYILGLTINENGFVVHNYVASPYTTYNDFVTNYINNNIQYQIFSGSGGGEYSAGLCQIKLTDNWYYSRNYTLSCSFKNIMIYPKIKFIGDSNNQLPNSAVSLSGLPSEYESTIYNLSMYLQIFYNGFSAGSDIEWIDTRRNVISPYYSGSNYNRTWTVNLAEGQTIAVGNDIRLTITMTESFFNNMGAGTTAVVNAITSKEFVIRLYSPTENNATNGENSQIVKVTDSAVFNYKEQIVGNYTYHFSAGSQSTASYEGKFDILSIKLQLNPLPNQSTYYSDIILLDNAANKLVFRISGGTEGAYQVIMTDKIGNQIYSSDTIYGLDGVDLFDGMSHTLKFYIDKLGTCRNYVRVEGENIETITADRFYKIMCVIDDTFSTNYEYLGGQVIETITYNPITEQIISEYNYDKYINFANNGYFGFILNNAAIKVHYFSAENLGVKLTQEGYVSDFMLWPSAASNGYSYYVADNGEIDTGSILDTISFNSGYGYNNIEVYTTVKSDLTGETVVGVLERGTYLITVTTNYRIDASTLRHIETRTIRLIIGQSSYSRVGIADGSNSVPKYSAPVTYQSEFGANYYTGNLGDYSYYKMVFDYDNISAGSSITTIFLKTNETGTTNITNYNENYPNYRGVALEIYYDEVTHAYTTKFLMRLGSAFWSQTFEGIEWAGNRNILETRFSKGGGTMLITLQRGGVLLFSYLVQNATIGGINSNHIKTLAEMSGYIGLSIFNVKMKTYAMELNSQINLCLDMRDSLITEDTVFVDGDDAPISTYNVSTFFSFKSTGTSFKLLFANTVGSVPNISGTTMVVNQENPGARGLYLLFNNSNVQLGVYKYNLEFWSQTIIGTGNLLNGVSHNITITLTKEVMNPANITEQFYKDIVCHKVNITIDGTTYSMGYPAMNDLSLIPVPAAGSSGRDREIQADINFLHDYRFLALRPTTGTSVLVNDIILY